MTLSIGGRVNVGSVGSAVRVASLKHDACNKSRNGYCDNHDPRLIGFQRLSVSAFFVCVHRLHLLVKKKDVCFFWLVSIPAITSFTNDKWPRVKALVWPPQDWVCFGGAKVDGQFCWEEERRKRIFDKVILGQTVPFQTCHLVVCT